MDNDKDKKNKNKNIKKIIRLYLTLKETNPLFNLFRRDRRSNIKGAAFFYGPSSKSMLGDVLDRVSVILD